MRALPPRPPGCTARLTPSLRSSLERIDADGARLREFSATLHAMQTMGRELTNSLQSQWRMEQQRAEQIAALTHDLKTPLSIIQGNADLLAEDDLTAAQHGQVDAILRGTDRARRYLAALRTAGEPPAAKKHMDSHTLVQSLAQTARALCAPGGHHILPRRTLAGGNLLAAESDLLRAAENLLDNAVRYTPRGGTVTLTTTAEDGLFLLRVTDRPRLYAGSSCQGGEMLYTDAARSDATPTRGWGCIFARKVAQSHGGVLVLSNLPAAHGAMPSCACRFANSA